MDALTIFSHSLFDLQLIPEAASKCLFANKKRRCSKHRYMITFNLLAPLICPCKRLLTHGLCNKSSGYREEKKGVKNRAKESDLIKPCCSYLKLQHLCELFWES